MNENQLIDWVVKSNPSLFKSEMIKLAPVTLVTQMRKAFQAGQAYGAKSIVPPTPKDADFGQVFDAFFNGKLKK